MSSGQIRRACILIALMSVIGYPQSRPFPDVTALSLEDLMNLKVTSVSKREQKLADAPAAIFVITQDDIRRSGARSVPEALRLVPGIEVARIDENKWAITSRGFNGRWANKLLVLIDGRSVYTPLFSGVYWNVQDVFLDDVDRIEVIRGPGATLWGANAVNGVINIITKEAQATQNALLTVQGGNDLEAVGGLRYGGKIGSKTYYRAYSKYFKWNSSTDANGQNAFDGWNTTRAGFRIDSSTSSDDSLTLQGDLYRGNYGETLTAGLLTPPYQTTFRNKGDFSGGNLLSRWNHDFSRSKTSLQLYYDRTNTAADSLLADHQNVYDLDFQHDVRVAESNELIWGLGYRYTQDKVYPTNYVSLNPDHRGLNLFSAFTQDELALFRQRLRVTLGSKFEHNHFTGFEVEPNARVLWTVNNEQSIWGAISRAVRTPARTEEGMRLNNDVIPPSAETGGLPVLVAIFGSRRSKPEGLLAYEGGYRFQSTGKFSADIAAFYNSYTDLLSADMQAPYVEIDPSPVHMTTPLVISTNMHGSIYGTELFSEWKGFSKWRMSGSYSFLNMDIVRSTGSIALSNPPGGASPRHQYYLRSSIDLTEKFQQDTMLRHVGSLDGLSIPGYYSLDARLGWKPTASLEFSISGQNLTNDARLEFRPDVIHTTPTQVKRTFHASATWRL